MDENYLASKKPSVNADVNNSSVVKTDFETVQKFISEALDIDELFGEKPLSRWCIEDNNFKSLKLLLENGCSKSFLLRSAIKIQNFAIFKYLIDQKCDVNEMDELHSPPLFTAVKRNLLEYAEYLIQYGADITMIYKKQSILSYAARLKSSDIARLLIKHGTPICCLKPNIPPIVSALMLSNNELVSLLLSLGADPNSVYISNDGRTSVPLDIAIKNKCSSTTTLLVLSGAKLRNISTRDLDEDSIQQVADFIEPSVIDCNTPIYDKLKEIIAEYKETHFDVEKIIAEIEQKCGSANFEYSFYIDEIRKVFLFYTTYVPKVIQFDYDITELRLQYIRSQFKVFEQTDKAQLTPLLKSEIEKYNEFFPLIVDLLNKNKIDEDYTRNDFIDFCIDEINKKRLLYETEEMTKLDFDIDTEDIPTDADESTKETRSRLLELNEIMIEYKNHLELVAMHINALEADFLFLIDTQSEKILNAQDILSRFPDRKNILHRAGLSQAIIYEIGQTVEPKMNLVSRTSKQLNENRAKILELSKHFKTLISCHYK